MELDSYLVNRQLCNSYVTNYATGILASVTYCTLFFPDKFVSSNSPCWNLRKQITIFQLLETCKFVGHSSVEQSA
jgi:hypothetical protein